MVVTVPGTRPTVCMQTVQYLYCSYRKGRTKLFMVLDATLACIVICTHAFVHQ